MPMKMTTATALFIAAAFSISVQAKSFNENVLEIWQEAALPQLDISIVHTPEFMPEIVFAGAPDATLAISNGAIGLIGTKDELAFLLIRSFYQADDAAKKDVEANALRHFLEQTSFNPSAAIQVYDRRIEALKHTDDSKKQSGLTLEETMLAREAAKLAIEETAWSKIDLSQRLEAYQPIELDLSARLSGFRHYLWAMHHFYGPDYQSHIQWQKDHPVIPTIAISVTAMTGLGVLLPKLYAASGDVITTTITPLVTRVAHQIGAAARTKIVTLAAHVARLGAAAGLVKIVSLTFFEKDSETQQKTDFLDALTAKHETYLARGQPITLEEFHQDFQSLHDLEDSYLRYGTYLHRYQYDYWFHPRKARAYHALLDLAVMSKIRSRQPLFMGQNSDLFSYPLLEKVGRIIDFDNMSQTERVEIYHYRHNNDLVRVATARLYLESLADYTTDSLEFRNAMGVFAYDNQPASIQFVQEIVSTKCATFIKGGHEDLLRRIIRSMHEKYDRDLLQLTKQCFADQVSFHDSYEQVMRQQKLIKEMFPKDYSIVYLADMKVADFMEKFDDVVAFANQVEGSGCTGDLASANGEALIRRPHLIKDMAGVNKVLDSDFFWGKKTNSKDINDQAHAAMREFVRAAKGYNIEMTEKLHQLLLAKVREFNPEMGTDEKIRLWNKFVERGTSVASDELFAELYSSLTDVARDGLMDQALRDGLLHDERVKKAWVMSELERFLPDFPINYPSDRHWAIKDFGEVSMRALGVGLAHAEVMERLSERIESSAQESQLIEQIKRNYADPAQTVIDDGIDLLIQIVQDTRDWSKDRQWEFVKFLTGQVLFVWDQATLDYLRQLSLTPAMIRKRFTILPNHYQYKIVDALLSQDGGLLASFDKSNRWVETIMQFFVDQVGSEAQTVARELFDAYAHALDTPGLRPFRSSLFARLLVSSTSENKSGQVVAQLCQHFGAFGIKLGQFLLATQILPPAENEALRDLEDSARAPTREEVYEDLRSIYGAQQVPYTVKRVLGGASLKYVVLATSPIGREVVLKVLARDAMIHTPLEAKIASRMGDYLVRKHGPKYSVFNTVIDAAAQAVKRELSFADEVERSKLARAHMYKTGALHPSIKLHMADEVLINNRLIEAEYVAGTAIYELDEAAQKSVAENLNQMEWDNFMGDEHAEKVYFDPDRHFGNYRMTAEQIAPIDFGQLHVLSIEQREQIMNVAAIAGILNEMARRSSWYVSYKASALADELQRVLALPPDSARQSLLTKQIKTEFASPKDNDIAAFYALLGALDQAGMFASIDRIPFYDVPKGLLQLSRLGEYLGEEFKSTTASERFKALVTKRAHAIAEALQLGH